MERKNWKLPSPQFDYRNFRLSKLKQPEYRYVFLLLFWPIYYIRYPIVEAINTADRCFEVSCRLDSLIPFHEGFIIPYQLWMVFLLAMTAYTFFYDIPIFKRYIQYMILAFSISTVIFLVFPTCQNLRPTVFPRDNFLTKIVRFIYAVDTNTNVCPSEHVIGSMAFLAAAINTKRLRNPIGITFSVIISFLTSIATVFLKQHSMVDVFMALPICLIAYLVCFPVGRRRNGRK